MGVFDKLAFWKKKDDFKDFGGMPDIGAMPQGQMPQDFGKNFGNDFGDFPNMTGQDNMGMPDDGFQNYSPPGHQAPMQQPFGSPMPPREDYKSDKFEVVSAKLDAIRYTLDSINQRLQNLERVAYEEKKRGW